ncbi:MAG: DUF2782 domain-containing protein [Gammaproteobacteria bacterium]|nr:MAG: DUF2782 domain-containing protein [Gammaproteobacteria bacterium]
MSIVASNPRRRNARYFCTFRDCRNLRKSSTIILATIVAWIAWGSATAEPVAAASGESPTLQALPEPPDIPPRVKSGETLEPEITIRRDDKQTITEYRINGRLHSIKVEPVVGPTYWLVDTTGDGFTDTRYNNYNPPFFIPGWVIFRW